MDWEAGGLLEGIDGGARAARAELLDALHADGVSPEELRVTAREERLVCGVLTTEGVPETAGDEGLDCSYAGEERLTGFASGVRAYRARRAGTDGWASPRPA